MAFEKFYITDKGATLLAKAQIGGTLTFTRAAAGDGTLGTQQPTGLTDIIHKVADLRISALSFSTPNIASVQIQFSNKNIQNPFDWEEIGLFAKGSDNTEVLYAYANAGNNPDHIPSYGTSPTEFIFLMNTAIGNSANVTAVIDTDLVYATQQDIADIKDGTIVAGHAAVADASANATHAVTADTAMAAAGYTEDGAIAAELSNLMSYSTFKTGLDSNGIYTELDLKRHDGTLIIKSVLNGGTSPYYITRTETYYQTDGITVKNSVVYSLSYDASGNMSSEVMN